MATDLNTGPNLPPKTDYGIGCIGAGFIMRDVHLAAYREAGFNPVAIASRTPEHAEAAEKPVAFTLEEAVEMVNAADEAGVKLGVNHNMRYDQSMRALKTLLDRGDLGEPVVA